MDRKSGGGNRDGRSLPLREVELHCPTPGQIFGSSMQPEKACDEENDDDDADDVKNVHGVLR
jgi:hypothetical protein